MENGTRHAESKCVTLATCWGDILNTENKAGRIIVTFQPEQIK